VELNQHMHNENYLLESSFYISLLTNRTLKESYSSIYNKYLTEGIHPRLATKLLYEEVKKNQAIIDKLYRKLKWRLQNMKSKNDPKLTKMVKDIVDKSDESRFEKDLVKLLQYMITIDALKESKYQDTLDKVLDVYDGCINKGKTHEESALRALISIPFVLKGTPSDTSIKVFKVLGLITILVLLCGLINGILFGGYMFIFPLIVAILSLIISGGRYYLIVSFY